MPIEQIFESYGNKIIAPAVSEGGGGTQVQSDWSQTDTSQPDYIKNKPTLSTVATSGDYEDLSNTPTIPDVSGKVNKAGDTMSGNLIVDRQNGTASSAGESYVQIGNNTAEGSAGNSYGELYLYSKSTKYVGLGARNLTGDRMIDLPDKSGTLVIASEYILEGTTTSSGALLIPNELRPYNFIALQYADDSAVTVGLIFRREYSYLTCLTNSLAPVSETTVKVKIIYI